MNVDDRKNENKFNEFYKKSLLFGSFGSAIGAGIGGYFSVVKGSYIYIGIGALIGGISGNLITTLFHNKISLQQVLNIKNKVYIILGILCLLFSITGIINFYLTGNWMAILGSLFFIFCGAYYILSSKKGQ